MNIIRSGRGNGKSIKSLNNYMDQLADQEAYKIYEKTRKEENEYLEKIYNGYTRKEIAQKVLDKRTNGRGFLKCVKLGKEGKK